MKTQRKLVKVNRPKYKTYGDTLVNVQMSVHELRLIKTHLKEAYENKYGPFEFCFDDEVAKSETDIGKAFKIVETAYREGQKIIDQKIDELSKLMGYSTRREL